MTPGQTLLNQSQDLRCIGNQSRLLAVTAKAIGSVHENDGNTPSLTGNEWLAAICDLSNTAQTDLLAIIADQLARTFLPGGDPGLRVTGSTVELSADTVFKLLTPFVVAGTAEAGAPLALLNAVDGTVEFAPITERFVAVRTITQNTGTTLTDTFTGATILVNSATAVTLLLPATLPAGFFCRVIRLGAGAVTISADTGAVVDAPNGHQKINNQYGTCEVYRISAGRYILNGPHMGA